MATKDFRASQIETSKIIASGSISGTSAGIAIYSGSVASNRQGGTTDSKMFDNVGSDVFLFVSGTISNDDNNRTDATLFGGDVVVSGTLYAERQVIEVDSVANGDFFVTGSMFVEPDADSTEAVAFRKANSSNVMVVNTVSPAVEINGDLILSGNIYGGPSEGNLIINSEGNIRINVDSNGANSEIFEVTANSSEYFKIEEVVGTVFNGANLSQSNFRVQAQGGNSAIFVDAGENAVALGWDSDSAPHWSELTDTGTDVKILLSGTVGSRGGATRGTTLNAGDLVVSGAFESKGTSHLEGTVTLGDSAELIVPGFIKHKSDINTHIRFNNDRIRFTTNNATNVDITSNQVIVVPGVGDAPTESEGVDINFYTSGAIGSRGTTTRGTSVFGGDLVVSGNVTALGSTVGFASPLTVRESDGSPNVNNVSTINVTNGTLTDNGGGTVTISVGGGNTLDQAYDQGGTGAGAKITVDGQPVQLERGAPGDIAFAVTGSSVFGETSAEFANNLPPLPGDDVTFFVSGSTKSLGSNTGGVSSFGGDVVVSGTLVMHERFDLLFGHHMTKNSITGDGPFLLINAGDSVMFGSGSGPSAAGSPDEANYPDINFFVSGAIDSKGSSTRGTALFGGDVVVSGSIYGKHLQTYHFVDNQSAAGTELFFGLAAGGGHASYSQVKHQRLAPYSGKLKKMLVRSNTGDNSNALVIKFYTNNGVSAQAGTPKTFNVQINASSPAQNNVTQVVNVSNTIFEAGNPFAFSMERASTAPGDVHLTAVFEYDVFDK